ncbi:MAG: hypothetical protein NTW49_02280 [Bacteroidia bacterium]|nr:hypothetical protein [Bacteroidia bacterium]
MSTFYTYSTENLIFKLFIKNGKIFHLFFILPYILIFINRIIIVFILPLTIIFIIIFIFELLLIKKLKPNGTIEVSIDKINWISENIFLQIDKEEIENIKIVKKISKSFIFSVDYNSYVLVNIFKKDNSLKQFLIKIYSIDNEKYNIINNLKLFSIKNGIIFDQNNIKFVN